jgi:ABC-2 type transport system permease protein
MISHVTNPTPGFPATPVAPNAWHAFGGVWRLTVRRFFAPSQWLGLAGLMVLIALPAFAIPRAGNPKLFAPQLAVGFYLTFLVPVFAFLTAAGAMRDEMKPESVDYILTRPVRRPAFLGFKFLSHLACVQIGFLPALGVLAASAVYYDVPHALALLPGLLLGQVMAITAFSAFGFLCAVLTGRFLVIGIVYAGVVEYAAGNIPTQLNRIAMTHQVKMLLQPMLAWTNPALKQEQSVFLCMVILLAFAVFMVGVAAAVFSRQELAGARPSEG